MSGTRLRLSLCSVNPVAQLFHLSLCALMACPLPPSLLHQPLVPPPLVTTAAKSHPRSYHSVNAHSTWTCKVIYIYTESKCLVTQGLPPSGAESCWFPLAAQCVPTADLPVRSHQLLVSLLWDSDMQVTGLVLHLVFGEGEEESQKFMSKTAGFRNCCCS